MTANPTTGGQNSSNRIPWPLFLKLGFSLGLLGLILYFVDLGVWVDVVANLSPWYLVAIIALVYADRALMAYKWDLLLQVAGVRIPFRTLFRTYLIAPLTGLLLPSTIGGDLFRVYNLSRYRVDTRVVLASIIAERLIGFVAMLVLASMSLGLAFYLLGDGWPYFKEVALALLLGAAMVVGLIAAALGGFRTVVDGLANRLAKYPGVGKLHRVYTVYSGYRNHRRTLARVSAWTFAEQLVPLSGFFLLAEALHVDVSPLELAAIIPLITLMARLPIPFDGLGVSEGLFVVFFGLVGLSAAEALVMATFARALQYIPGLPWAVHYVLRDRHTAIPGPQDVSAQPRTASYSSPST